MILHNGDVLFGWPLQSHVITAGWFYNDGSLHRALDFRAAVGTPVYAAADGTVETCLLYTSLQNSVDNLRLLCYDADVPKRTCCTGGNKTRRGLPPLPERRDALEKITAEREMCIRDRFLGQNKTA